MAKVRRVGLDEIIGYFDDLEDPRDTVNRKHPLVSVVVIALMAVLSGAGGPTAIARWAALKADFLTRLTRNTFHSPWYIQFSEAEPQPLLDWLKARYPPTAETGD